MCSHQFWFDKSKGIAAEMQIAKIEVFTNNFDLAIYLFNLNIILLLYVEYYVGVQHCWATVTLFIIMVNLSKLENTQQVI
jgi:hypothetical protein